MKTPMSQADAEAIAIEALAWLAQDKDLLVEVESTPTDEGIQDSPKPFQPIAESDNIRAMIAALDQV